MQNIWRIASYEENIAQASLYSKDTKVQYLLNMLRKKKLISYILLPHQMDARMVLYGTSFGTRGLE